MSEPVSILIQGFKAIPAIWSTVKRAYAKGALTLFQRRDRPPLSTAECSNIAFSLLSGPILKALSFRNFGSKRTYIFAAREDNSNSWPQVTVHLLVQTGSTYREIWHHKPEQTFFDTDNCDVVDINGDGHKELLFEDSDGTPNWVQRNLYCYSIVNKQLYTLRHHQQYGGPLAPRAPQVTIEPEAEPELMAAIESAAERRGLLRPVVANPSDPQLADFRWHLRNGHLRNGIVSLEMVTGPPMFSEEVYTQRLQTGHCEWLSVFKGALYCYDKTRNCHFVVFSSRSVYGWVRAIVYDGSRLWFSVHMEPRLISFCQLSETEGQLHAYTHYRGEPLPTVDDLSLSDGTLLLNGTLKVPLSQTHRLECRSTDANWA